MHYFFRRIVVILFFLLPSLSYADENTQILNSILARLNQLPNYIASWLDTDDKNNYIPINGTLFSLFNQSSGTDETSRLSYTNTLVKLYYGGSVPKDANDYSYTTLRQTYLNSYPSGSQQQSLISKSIANYMQYVSGNGIRLDSPDDSWVSNKASASQKSYYALYKTMAAMQSYNDYIISKLMIDQQANTSYPKGIPSRSEGQAANTTDILAATTDLAGSSSWYSDVGSESLGLVLRQMLIFNSQMYILLTRIYQTEQQMLVAQSLANALTMSSLSLGYGQLLYTQALSGQ